MALNRRRRSSAIALDITDQEMAARRWSIGDRIQHGRLRSRAGLVLRRFGDAVADRRRYVAAYLERLMKRPSFARAVKEAQPYFALFPKSNETNAKQKA